MPETEGKSSLCSDRTGSRGTPVTPEVPDTDDSHNYHDSSGYRDEHLSQRGHDDDHRNQRYDRTTLLNMSIWGVDRDVSWRAYLPLRCPYSSDPRSVLVPVGFPTLLNSRKLDHPCYGGRYRTSPQNNDHSNKPDDSQLNDYTQRPTPVLPTPGHAIPTTTTDERKLQPRQLQQEPLWSATVGQGCYEHPTDLNIVD